MNTDDFAHYFSEIDKEKVKTHLLSLSEPCYESTLLRIAFPDMSISTASPLILYRNHFLLFHLLYQLQDEFYKDDKYLFVHFMRTFLLPYPQSGQCRFYEEYSGRFCNTITSDHQSYCEFHQHQLGESAIELLSVKYFYLDESNFFNLNEETAEAFINGTWEILRNYDAYQKSFEVLGISETWDTEKIKKRFRVLAQTHHPDKGAASHEKFNEINNAYCLLMKAIPNHHAK